MSPLGDGLKLGDLKLGNLKAGDLHIGGLKVSDLHVGDLNVANLKVDDVLNGTLTNGVELSKRAFALLLTRRAELKLPNLRTMTLAEFRAHVEEMGAARNDASTRDTIIDQAAKMLQHFYAHRPYKEQRYQVQPLDRLAELKQRAGTMSTLEFHTAMVEIFDSVRDSHTGYTMPPPFTMAAAVLPFQMQRVTDLQGVPAYVVTGILPVPDILQFGLFGPGAKILEMGQFDPNDTKNKTHHPTIEEAILKANEVGGNSAAAMARGALRATVRPLGHATLPKPEEELVTITYMPAGTTLVQRIQFQWTVLAGFDETRTVPKAAFSTSLQLTVDRYSQEMLYYGEGVLPSLLAKWGWEQPAADVAAELAEGPRLDDKDTADPEIISALPEQFRFQHTGGRNRKGIVRPLYLKAEDQNGHDTGRKFGYVRILQFAQEEFVPTDHEDLNADEFRRILEFLNRVAPDGLIVDIRGNGGGDIRTAERCLQLMYPELLQPANFHLANTAAVFEMIGRAAGDSVPGRFKNSGVHAVDPLLTESQHLTDTSAILARGQAYMGPVVLVTDGLTYSAADIFSGGFEDHGIGKVVGMHNATGGGGASVWEFSELLGYAGTSSLAGLKPLPPGVGMRLAALRSSRVVPAQAGTLNFIEDVGVQPNHEVYTATPLDIISDFGQMCRHICADILAKETRARVDLEGDAVMDDAGLTVQVRVKGADRLSFHLHTTRTVLNATFNLVTKRSVQTTQEIQGDFEEIVPVGGQEVVMKTFAFSGATPSSFELTVLGMSGDRVVARLWRQLQPVRKTEQLLNT